jgi:GTPase SAR1 family protein
VLREWLNSRALSKGLLLIYGEGGAGKTAIIFSLIKHWATRGRPCLYAFTGRLHPRLVEELTPFEDGVTLIKLRDFKDQGALVRGLHKCEGAGYELVAFDTFTELYRLFTAETSDPIKACKLLNQQLAMLSELADKGMLVVLASRARRLADDLEPEASSLLEYWSSLILRVERLGKPKWRRLIFEKGPTGLEGSRFELPLWSNDALQAAALT